jgi:hypothetical protein
MNKRERQLIEQLVEYIEHPSVRGTTYTESDGKLSRVEHVSLDETSRRLQSDDFKLGWQACREYVNDYANQLLHPKPKRRRR